MKKATELVAAAGGAIASFFIKMPPLVWILIAVMTIDFITGLICGAMGKSNKTENGYISSSTAFVGLLKKALIIFVVLLAALLSHVLEPRQSGKKPLNVALCSFALCGLAGAVLLFQHYFVGPVYTV